MDDIGYIYKMTNESKSELDRMIDLLNSSLPEGYRVRLVKIHGVFRDAASINLERFTGSHYKRFTGSHYICLGEIINRQSGKTWDEIYDAVLDAWSRLPNWNYRINDLNFVVPAAGSLEELRLKLQICSESSAVE
jgi:hypothetical protein